MTDVKREGFTMLAHEFVDNRMPTLSRSAVVLAVFIARHTLGKGKTSAQFSIRELSASTGLSERTIQRAIPHLKGVVGVNHEPGQAPVWQFEILPVGGPTKCHPPSKVQGVPPSNCRGRGDKSVWGPPSNCRGNKEEELSKNSPKNTPLTDQTPAKSPDSPPSLKTEPDYLQSHFGRLAERYPGHVDLDHAFRTWMSLIDSGDLTEQSVPEIAAGLDRPLAGVRAVGRERRQVDSIIVELAERVQGAALARPSQSQTGGNSRT